MRALSASLATIALMAAISSPTHAQPQQGQDGLGERRGPPPALAGQSYANSSAMLVADIAFARLARDKGQWTAFRETAAPDAITFFDGARLADTWLKGRVDPPEAARWKARKLFIACDGRTGAVTGTLQFPNGPVGIYTTVWNNRAKPRAKKPLWKWVLNQGARMRPTEPVGDMIASRTAVCTGNPKAALGDMPMGPVSKGREIAQPQPSGARASADGTMVWRWNVQRDGSHTITIDLWNGNAFETVVRDEVSGDDA